MDKLFNASLLLDVPAAGSTDGAATGNQILGLLPTLIFLVLMFVVLYFFMIRPQKKKEKAVKAMLDALKVGDRVLTIGGIYGTVTGVKDDQVIIAVGAQKTVMNMARWAIKSVEDAPLENDKEPEI
ncbi:MAG: preprotein translocase subunit YajC [Clostridia bacterium]|nr:preprotein translocase subunit YajC [Clostridia bacterium]